MSRSKSIWNKVTSCKYQSDKSFGAHNDCSIETFTGSSSSNSHLLCKFEIRKKIYDKIIVFNAYIDLELIKQTIFENNKDKAGNYIERRSSDFVNQLNVNEYQPK
jgi:hypothetical protein